jgi:dihydrofolate reductase
MTSRRGGGPWPQDARRAPDRTTFLPCDPAEAVRIGLEAAGGKNLEVFSPNIGRQLLELGLVDEIDLHVAPILLGDGIRLYDNPGGEPIRLHRVGEGHPTATSRSCRFAGTSQRPGQDSNLRPAD